MTPRLGRPPSFWWGLALALWLPLSLTACSADRPGSTPPVDPVVVPIAPPPSASEPSPLSLTTGVSDHQILFGQSAAFTGPAQELGLNMRLGIEAAFKEVNQHGGVHGRQLALTSRDDAYEPEAAIANTQTLIEKDRVFALIGAVGTPTSRSATPVAAQFGVPYIAPFTGAAFLRDPHWNNIINMRASYNQETEEMVARLTTDLGITNIAVIYQDDSFGRAGYRGVRAALDRRDLDPVAIGVYPRNTTAVKTALLDIRRGSPEAVIIVGAYQPVAALIAWAQKTGMNPVFMTLSFVGSYALADKLGADGAGVFVTQVVPFPHGDAYPVVPNYRRALAAHAPEAEPGFGSLEGYLAGRLAIYGLETCGPEADRKCFLEALKQSEDFDIDGFPLGYGEADNQGSDRVFLTVIDEKGEYRPAHSLLDGQP